MLSLVLVHLIAFSLCLPSPGVETANEVELEAFLGVEEQLNSINEDQSGHHQRYAEQSAILMQTLLESRESRQLKDEPEDSRTGEVFGLSSRLMRQLIELYTESQLGNAHLVTNQSALIGVKLADFHQRLGIDLPNLAYYLAALMHSAGNLEEQHFGDNSNVEHDGQRQPASRPKKEKSWWDKLVDWFK